MTSGDDQSGLDDRLGGKLFGGEARTADYQAWAERLRAKRDKAKKTIADTKAPASEPAAPNYWSSDSVFAESDRLRQGDQAEVHSAWEAEERKQQLAFDLGMHNEINLPNATDAYRRLAKLHHPDRYSGTEQAVQDHHASEMIKINSAYTALKKLLAEG